MTFKKTLVFISSTLAFALTFPAQAGEWKKEHAGRMDYWLYLPTATKRVSARPLMLNLHGCGQRSDALKQSGNWENAADTYQMVVAIPQVPGGGVVMGCWDYYGTDHQETNRHNKDLIELVESLVSDASLKIDPRAIYVSGLSSGGGEALVLACLRPDLIAGVGLSSAPALGSGMGDLHQTHFSLQQAQELCLKLAGSHKEQLSTQLAAIISGDQDFVLDPAHSAFNHELLSSLYGADRKTEGDPKSLPGSKTDGSVEFDADQSGTRIAKIVNNGLGHNWPAGTQGGKSLGVPLPAEFISQSSVSFPDFLARFFHDNRRR